MMRCQVCGKRKPRRADGRIVMHYRKGSPCMGVGELPIEEERQALYNTRDHWRARDSHFQAIWADHRARRLNAPLEAWFWAAWHDASVEAGRLDRRIMRVLREVAA